MTMHDNLSEFVTRLRESAGPNLKAVFLYGSAARDQHDEKYSDINLLCVLSAASGEALNAVSPVAQWWTKSAGRRPPMFLTTGELAGSADVFAIETLDLKAAHKLLYGEDVLAAIDVPMNLHRVQLEHELRTLILRLRQHYLLAASDDENLKAVIAKSASSAVTMLRHALIAVGEEAPDDPRAVVSGVERTFKIDSSPVSLALDVREHRLVETETRALYRSYMECLSALAAKVDQLAPRSQWQRIGPQDSQ